MTQFDLDAVYCPSEDIVSRDIEGETILVPLVSGIGDMEEDLFSLNDTGRAVWRLLDGARSVRQIVTELTADYRQPADAVALSVSAFIQELLRRRMLVEATRP